jgi:hypothetical protein
MYYPLSSTAMTYSSSKVVYMNIPSFRYQHVVVSSHTACILVRRDIAGDERIFGKESQTA